MIMEVDYFMRVGHVMIFGFVAMVRSNHQATMTAPPHNTVPPRLPLFAAVPAAALLACISPRTLML